MSGHQLISSFLTLLCVIRWGIGEPIPATSVALRFVDDAAPALPVETAIALDVQWSCASTASSPELQLLSLLLDKWRSSETKAKALHDGLAQLAGRVLQGTAEISRQSLDMAKDTLERIRSMAQPCTAEDLRPRVKAWALRSEPSAAESLTITRLRRNTLPSASVSLLEEHSDALGSVVAAARERSDENEKWQSLAEVSSFLHVGVPGLKDIMEPILQTVLDPVTSQLMTMVGSSTLTALQQEMPDQMEGEVPEDIAACLNVALTHNLTAILTDAVTAKTTQDVSSKLSEALFGSLRWHVFRELRPRAQEQLAGENRGQRGFIVGHTPLDAGSLVTLIRHAVLQLVADRLHRTIAIALVPRITETLSLSITGSLLSRWRPLPEDILQQTCAGKERCDPQSINEVWASHVGRHYALYYSRYYAAYYDAAARAALALETEE